MYYTSVYFLVCVWMGGGAAVLCSLCLRLFGQSLSLFLSPTLQITPRQVHTINVLHVFQPNGNCVSDGHGLVTIRMKPDDHGRFGFNVKVRTLLISLLSVSLFFIYFLLLDGLIDDRLYSAVLCS